MFLGLATSNWLIWLAMAVFIAGYFVVTEIVNRREAARSHDPSHDPSHDSERPR